MAKAVNGIGLAEAISTCELAPLAVVTPTTRSRWPLASRTRPTHRVSGRPSQSRSLTVRMPTPAGGGAPIGAQPPAAEDRAAGTVNNAATNSSTDSSALRIGLHRVHAEHRTAAGQRLELLGPTVGDQPRPLHETDTGGDLFGENPQQWPGLVGRQLDHPNALLLAAAAECDLVCGPDVSDPVRSREATDHVPLAVHRHRGNRRRPGNAGLAAAHRQHHRAFTAEAKAHPRHLDEHLVGRFQPPGRLDVVSVGHACHSSQVVGASTRPTASNRAIAPALKATSAAPMFSSRCAIDRVPGISSVFGAWANSQASPTWAGVTPSSPAMSATTALSETLGKPGNDDPSGKNGTQAIPSPPGALQAASVASCARSIRL